MRSTGTLTYTPQRKVRLDPTPIHDSNLPQVQLRLPAQRVQRGQPPALGHLELTADTLQWSPAGKVPSCPRPPLTPCRSLVVLGCSMTSSGHPT